MNFDPMVQVPETDEQAMQAISHGKDELIGKSGCGLYLIYRQRDGMSVLQAYEEVLLLLIARQFDKAGKD